MNPDSLNKIKPQVIKVPIVEESPKHVESSIKNDFWKGQNGLVSVVSIKIEKRMRSQDWPLKEQMNVGARFGRRSVGERKRASRSLWKWSVIAVWRCGPVIIQEEVRAAGHGVGRKEPPLLLIPELI